MFNISWIVSEIAWQEAHQITSRYESGSDYDLQWYALVGLLPGRIEFTDNGALFSLRGLTDEEWPLVYRRERPKGFRPEEATSTSFMKGWQLCLPDFAVQLAHILNVERFEEQPPGSMATFHHSDDALEIVFRKQSFERVDIYSHEWPDYGWKITVSASDFLGGSSHFLRDFAGALRAETPSLLKWKTFEVLVPYVSATGIQ
jgi:hypothetical protein